MLVFKCSSSNFWYVRFPPANVCIYWPATATSHQPNSRSNSRSLSTKAFIKFFLKSISLKLVPGSHSCRKLDNIMTQSHHRNTPKHPHHQGKGWMSWNIRGVSQSAKQYLLPQRKPPQSGRHWRHRRPQQRECGEIRVRGLRARNSWTWSVFRLHLSLLRSW